MKIKVISKDWLNSFFQSLRTSMKINSPTDEENFTLFKKIIIANIEYGSPDDISPDQFALILETEDILEDKCVDLALTRKNLPLEFAAEFKEKIKEIQKFLTLEEQQNNEKIEKVVNVTEKVELDLNSQIMGVDNEIDLMSKRLNRCKKVFMDEMRKSLGTYGTVMDDSVVSYFNNL